jgi:membrane protease YdiL (CAAX protease family)
VFDLYSDLDTRIDHFRRAVRLSLVLLPLILVYMGYLVYMSIVLKGFWLSAIPYYAMFIVLLGCIGFGLVKSYRAYRRLKKERIMRE